MQSGTGRRLSPFMLQSAVGLTVLVALGLLGWLLLWLSNFSFGNRSYRATFIFPNAGGMSVGTRVAYRGVRVGRIVSINPEPKGVAIGVEISPADRLIPANSSIEATQAGLVGETSIDIIPLEGLPPAGVKAEPLDPNCDPRVIICNGSRLQGEGKLDVNALIRSLLRIADVIDDPEFTSTVRIIAQRTTDALGNISTLSKEASGLIKDTRGNRTFDKLDNTLLSLNQAADSIPQVANDINQAAGSLERLGNQASSLLEDAQQQGTINNLNTTLVSLRGFSEQVRSFITVNQGNIANTLADLGQTSQELAVTLRKVGPILNQVEQSKFLNNLDTISNNTAALTANLRDISTQLNDPATIVQLQQILDAARAVFENANKITSDLDELTGNPQFRRDLRRMIEGLSNLVSSSEQLQQQLEYAEVLNRVAIEVNRIQSPENISLKPKNISPSPINPKNINPSLSD